ncbi:transcription factor IIIB 90 kDa subunit-like [Pomacea canaliculata]|uniref:transcription factor IIIB 90 kDa subunit-like n=1 Tax=Pomacea canaliculata TaxID=400727 RepID=UPI000D74001D|nr:transcription factor IIIB 90 kDa subunit-like [Pomacea canaliculata]XP_025104658.1 transcription factor IIIB 90 kDa subunit-like [Pomacea canaliculata]XP_025104659.1 transcription factor IIIB 90 kDa subunit-like [Pomacea canaliculata]
MSEKVCQHCGCNEIDIDPSRGDAVCTSCGSVLEDQIIVSEVQFQENAAGGASVIGQFVSNDGTKSHSFGGTFSHGIGRESRAVTLQNGKRKIQEIGAQLRLNQHCMDTAFNFYKMAVTKRLTRGRKITHVIATCLYLVCRTEGTPHMLLDFSDVLQVNVYMLGKTFLHISKELCLNIPAIDPCLYVPRFAHKLQFGEKTHEVSMTALRLVARMKRDWMHTGRRPSGLCGAALLVAARMHDFARSVKEIIKVVKVCEATIRKRLMEFHDTPSSQLTIEEFHNIDLEEEQDPPCFTEGKMRSKLAQLEEQNPQLTNQLANEVSNLQQEIEKSLEPKKPRGIFAAYAKMVDDSPNNDIDEVTKFIEEETLRFVDGIDLANQPLIEVSENKPEISQLAESALDGGDFNRSLRVSNLAPTAASLGIKEMVEECITSKENKAGESVVGGELDLDGIDDSELDKFLLSEEEVRVKTKIWMRENEDYLKAQKEKEEKKQKEQEEAGQKLEKKKRKHKKRNQLTEASSAREALAMIIQERKLSNKINYEVLHDLNIQAAQTDKEKIHGLGGSPADNEKNQKKEPTLNRFKRPSLFTDIKVESVHKKIKIQEPIEEKQKIKGSDDVASVVVVESGPVQYEEPEEEELAEEDEEEEEAELSARDYFAIPETTYDEEGYEDDY